MQSSLFETMKNEFLKGSISEKFLTYAVNSFFITHEEKEKLIRLKYDSNVKSN